MIVSAEEVHKGIGFRDRRGNIILEWIRNVFYRDVLENIETIKSCYEEWRDAVQYIVLKRSYWLHRDLKHEVRIIKCRKRGNDVHRRFVYAKINRIHKTNLNGIFITLTFRPLPVTLNYMWENVGKFYNTFITKFRAYCKKKGLPLVGILRTFESHQASHSYYPHVHLLCLFSRNFVFKRYFDNDKVIAKMWKWGFTKTQYIKNKQMMKAYLVKYIVKGKGYTNALEWFYRKRGFSCSHAILDLIKRSFSIIQIAPFGQYEYMWEFLGIFNAFQLKFEVKGFSVTKSYEFFVKNSVFCEKKTLIS